MVHNTGTIQVDHHGRHLSSLFRTWLLVRWECTRVVPDGIIVYSVLTELKHPKLALFYALLALTMSIVLWVRSFFTDRLDLILHLLTSGSGTAVPIKRSSLLEGPALCDFPFPTGGESEASEELILAVLFQPSGESPVSWVVPVVFMIGLVACFLTAFIWCFNKHHPVIHLVQTFDPHHGIKYSKDYVSHGRYQPFSPIWADFVPFIGVDVGQ